MRRVSGGQARRHRRRLLLLLAAAASVAAADETVQPGFVLHDGRSSPMRLSDVRSGELCADIGGSDEVCAADASFTVKGHDTCIGRDQAHYPCTRYGYRFDFDGAVPGSQIECTATRRDPFRSDQRTYTVALESEAGTVYQPTWIVYAPVERRAMLTEVHECSYLGESFATIEYIISYEPSAELAPLVAGGPGTRIAEPYLPGVPQSCDYLDEDLADLWTRGEVERDFTDHVPNLRSHCAYSAVQDAAQRARIEFKFRPYEMFDVETLNPMQLMFNAAFSASGSEPALLNTDIGKVSFIYNLPPDRTVLMVITGIQGPADGAGRPMELAAHFDLRDGTRTHEQRLDCITYLAEQSLEFWFSKVRESDNTIVLDEAPAIHKSCTSG